VHFTLAPERMPPLAEDTMSPEQRQAAAELTAGPRGEVKGPFVSLLRSPEFMRRVQKVNEFAAIIAARHWNQQFEWWAHYRQALEAGLDRAIADAVAEGRRPAGMAEDEEIVYDLLTEVLQHKGASDATYARAVGKFGEQGLIDIIGIAGYYALLAMVMNVTRTAVPEGPPLPLAALPVRAIP
jgi:4-carboxymuconolactone decarboxylase